MNIIPAIDIIDGQCVRLTKGDFDDKKIYSDNPLTVAKAFEKLGVTKLHVVDLDGAKAGKVTNWNTARQLAEGTGLDIDFGGGITNEEDINRLLEFGIKQVNIGSIAVREQEKTASLIKTFGPETIILAADVKGGFVATKGWRETSELSLVDLVAQYQKYGITYITCTDVSKDGTLTGPNFDLYKDLLAEFPTLMIIASGGVSGMEDVHQLKDIGLYGCIIGKAFYEGTIGPDQVQMYLRIVNPTGSKR